jgi:DNA replication protein DnaC
MIDDAALRDLLARLQLHYLIEHLDDLVSEATRSRWGAREVIEAVAQRETTERQRRSVERRRRLSRIGQFKPLEAFDWAWPTAIDREQIERLMQLDFITEKENVVIAGAQGLGKTMMAQNIAHQAVLAGHSVLSISAGAMLLDLGQQDSPRALQSRIGRYTSPRLLVLDEVGYLSYDTRSADLLFEVVSRRYEQGSILLTTNLAFSDWPNHFPGAGCVTAMIDRLTHHCEVVAIEGKSYRLKEAQDRKENRAAAKRKRKS